MEEKFFSVFIILILPIRREFSYFISVSANNCYFEYKFCIQLLVLFIYSHSSRDPHGHKFFNNRKNRIELGKIY